MTLYSNKELLANNTSEVLHFLDSKEVILLDILERFDKTYAVAFLLNNRKIAILKYITNFNNWCTLEINKSQYIYIDQPTNIVYLNTCSNSTQSADSTQYTIYLCKEIVEDLINGKDVTKYSNINNYLKYMTINSYEEYMNLIKIISSSEFIHYEITWAGTTNIDSMEYPFVKIKELKNNLNNMDNYKYILFTDNFKNYKVVEKIGNTVTCLFTKAFNF